MRGKNQTPLAHVIRNVYFRCNLDLNNTNYLKDFKKYSTFSYLQFGGGVHTSHIKLAQVWCTCTQFVMYIRPIDCTIICPYNHNTWTWLYKCTCTALFPVMGTSAQTINLYMYLQYIHAIDLFLNLDECLSVWKLRCQSYKPTNLWLPAWLEANKCHRPYNFWMTACKL